MTVSFSAVKFPWEEDSQSVNVEPAQSALTALASGSVTEVGPAEGSTFARYVSEGGESLVDWAKGIKHMLAHPVETLIKPPVRLAIDSNVLSAKVTKGLPDPLGLVPVPLVPVPEEMEDVAAKRMHERKVDLVKAGKAFKEADGPRRLRMAIPLVLDCIVPGLALKGVRGLMRAPKPATLPQLQFESPTFMQHVPPALLEAETPYIALVMEQLKGVPPAVFDADRMWALGESIGKLPTPPAAARFSTFIRENHLTTTKLSGAVERIQYRVGDTVHSVIRRTPHDPSALVSEMSHLHELRTLKHGRVPTLLALDEGSMLLSFEAGVELNNAVPRLLKAGYRLELETMMTQFGRLCGEFTSRRLDKITAKQAKVYSERLVSNYEVAFDEAMGRGMRLPDSIEDIYGFCREFEKNPGYLSLGHDDFHGGNFLWDRPSRQVVMLEPGGLDGGYLLNPKMPMVSFYEGVEEIQIIHSKVAQPSYVETSINSYVAGFKETYTGSMAQQAFAKRLHFYPRLISGFEEGGLYNQKAVLEALKSPY